MTLNQHDRKIAVDAFHRLLSGLSEVIAQAGLLCADPEFSRNIEAFAVYRGDLACARDVLNGIIARLGAEQ